MVDVFCHYCSNISKFDLNSLTLLYDRGQNPALKLPQEVAFVPCKNCNNLTCREKIIIIHDPVNRILLLSIPENILEIESYFCFISDTIIKIVDTTPSELRGTYLLI